MLLWKNRRRGGGKGRGSSIREEGKGRKGKERKGKERGGS